MTYELYIGDPSFSSWSLCGWLTFEKFGIPYHQHMLGLYARGYHRVLRVARTIADLDGSASVRRPHIAKTASYRIAFSKVS